MKHITIGILAHVDAGKTTLSEALLYSCGSIRKLGRVDHKDAFLDTFSLERLRGITIFSKQAELMFGENLAVTLLDTPGHVDFSAEMERTLGVLDYAILVINGADGIQGHTRTLWRLLKQYEIPTFLFVNKMDQDGTDHDKLLEELRKVLDDGCVELVFKESAINLSQSQEEGQLSFDSLDALAMCNEVMMEEFIQTGDISRNRIVDAIANRCVFPCFFGSALKLQGVSELIRGVIHYADVDYVTSAPFGARVYKISRDAGGNRLTHMKIMSGTLKVKTLLNDEKIDQIRIYSGTNYSMTGEVSAGQVCAVTGLSTSYCGQGYGICTDITQPVLEPVLNYQIILPEDVDVYKAWKDIRQLEEENPLLRISYHEASGEIHIQVMGEVELDVLKAVVLERFHLDVSFGMGSLVYKETIDEVVEGIGHFEPLRHYAEVHLLMEPGKRGTGIQLETNCSEDILERNWQRLILTHLAERIHPGVLTGSELTDVKITLVTGRAHTKHTEGGDFRQATYRAVRQGLMKAKSVLLEPVYEYRLEVPASCAGRAIADIQKMCGNFDGPDMEGDMAVLYGTAPVATMSGYQTEVNEYTHGMGKLFCSLKGYMPCHNADEVIAHIGYDPDADTDNPTGSVFCSHGAGFIVPWYQVEEYMHMQSGIVLNTGDYTDEESINERNDIHSGVNSVRRNSQSGSGSHMSIGEDEIREIFERTYGAGSMDRKFYNKNDYDDYYNDYDYENNHNAKEGISVRDNYSSGVSDSKYQKHAKAPKKKEQYLLVDGYNIIFAWEELKSLSEVNLEAARGKLMDIMCNYQGYKQMNLILVFDAYKVQGNVGEMFDYHNIHVVYTKEAETADQYIEKLVRTIAKDYEVTVATSDGLEQLIVMGGGARRMSARNLKEEVERMEQEIRDKFLC